MQKGKLIVIFYFEKSICTNGFVTNAKSWYFWIRWVHLASRDRSFYYKMETFGIKSTVKIDGMKKSAAGDSVASL